MFIDNDNLTPTMRLLSLGLSISGGEGEGDKGGAGDGEGDKATGNEWVTKYVPEALRSEKTWAKFKGTESEAVGQLATSYHNLEKRLGSAINLPAPDAKPEEAQPVWNEIYTKLGRPENPAGYEAVKVPDTLKDRWDAEAEKAVNTKLHALGLTKAQQAGVMGAYLEYLQGTVDTQANLDAESYEKAWSTLKAKWGAVTQRNVNLHTRTIEDFGDDELRTLLDTELPGIGKLGNHPAFVAFGARVGQILLEDGVIKSDAINMTADTAQKEIAAVMSNMSHPYWKYDDPNHKAAVERMRELHQVAYGSV
jgi:hypothetical protein